MKGVGGLSDFPPWQHLESLEGIWVVTRGQVGFYCHLIGKARGEAWHPAILRTAARKNCPTHRVSSVGVEKPR
jgi:hypothetical protein